MPSVKDELKRARAHGRRRVRSMAQMRHKVSGYGKGKWHSRRTLWAYTRKRKRLNKIAAASRARNRAA